MRDNTAYHNRDCLKGDLKLNKNVLYKFDSKLTSKKSQVLGPSLQSSANLTLSDFIFQATQNNLLKFLVSPQMTAAETKICDSLLQALLTNH